jgi:hypothetical protein
MHVPVMEVTLPDGKAGRVTIGTYPNGRLGIVLECLNTEFGEWEPYATLTCNLPDEPLGKDEVFIKHWSENEGLDVWAIAQGIIMPQPNGEAPSGFVLVPRYSLQLAFYKRAFNAALDAVAKPREGLGND